MGKYILTVTLNPALDKTVKISGFKTGFDHRENGINISAGGKGINVSRALNIMGERNLATGISGGASGNHLLEQLKEESIKNDFLTVGDQTRTNLTIIDPSSGDITRVIEKGPKITLRVFGLFKARFKFLLKNASYVIFSGANANGLNDGVYRELIKLSRKMGVDAALDTRAGALMEGLKAKPLVLKSNLEEAEYIFGCKLNTVSKIMKAAKYIASKGPAIVLITIDKKGAIAYDGKEMLCVSGPVLKPVNDVGCGDAFLAAFIASRQRGLSFGKALKIAAAAGSANALTVKPGSFHIKDMKALASKIKVRPIF